MELTVRSVLTIVHGMGFGALYLMACSGALVELYRRSSPQPAVSADASDGSFLAGYMAAMAATAWLAVLSGTYLIYPWYRAAPPAGTANLSAYPQRLLMANPSTIGWHSMGMEWKEHVAWLVPIAITMAAIVCRQYGRNLKAHRELRLTVLSFVWIALFAAAVAGFFGAMINKNAPVQGGATLHLMEGAHK